jgi:hypothetical protein
MASSVTAMPATRMSEAEWQTRVDLAACYRLVDLFGRVLEVIQPSVDDRPAAHSGAKRSDSPRRGSAGNRSISDAPDSQVRTGLTAGGKWIRTPGPAPKKGRSEPIT